VLSSEIAAAEWFQHAWTHGKLASTNQETCCSCCRVAQRSAGSTPSLSRTTSTSSSTAGLLQAAARRSRAPDLQQQPPLSALAAWPSSSSAAAAAAGPPDTVQPADTSSSRPDYLRQQREERELAAKAAELDAKLRAVRLAEPLEPGSLSPEALQPLLQECLRRQAVVEAAAAVGGTHIALHCMSTLNHA
jgi:hypothetical protein